jgi:hypothetical protein
LDPTKGDPYFPVSELSRLEEMISMPRWVVPVLPKCKLEILLDASIDLCRRERIQEVKLARDSSRMA